MRRVANSSGLALSSCEIKARSLNIRVYSCGTGMGRRSPRGEDLDGNSALIRSPPNYVNYDSFVSDGQASVSERARGFTQIIPPTAVGGLFKSILKRSDLKYPPTAVGGIKFWFRNRVCRKDLNHPPTAVGGIPDFLCRRNAAILLQNQQIQ